MARRWDAVVARETERDGTKKTYWTKIGAAFEGAKGIKVVLDGLPVNGELHLFEPKQGGQGRGGSTRDDNDDITF